MKTEKTKDIEYTLIKKYCSKFFGNYGALEVPIDYTLGKGKQNIDFAYYKADKQDIYCFEIKISKSDFNSPASLSFNGNYNYLVADKNLARYLYTNWHNQSERQNWTHQDLAIHGIGLIEYDNEKLTMLIKPKRHEIHLSQKMSLIEGILRAGCRDATKGYLDKRYL